MKTNNLQVILDTNVLMVSFLPHHKHFWLYQALENDEFTLLISNEILEEYFEKIAEKYNVYIADILTFGLANLRNTRQISPSVRWLLITDDPDDNKFSDCAVAGNADYLVTNDKHFNVLKTIDYPIIAIVSLDEFKSLLGK